MEAEAAGPLFLYLPYQNVHSPDQVEPRAAPLLAAARSAPRRCILRGLTAAVAGAPRRSNPCLRREFGPQEPAPWETHAYPAWAPGRGETREMQVYANMLDMLDSGAARPVRGGDRPGAGWVG